jgi:predicted  nucleic acid-binding Zn-ribbon protein
VEIIKGGLLDKYHTGIDVRITVKGAAEYSFEAGRGESDNNVVRLKNLFAKVIPSREENTAAEAAELAENLEQAINEVDTTFEHEQKIVDLEKRLDELNEKLSDISKPQEVFANEDELEAETERIIKEEAECADGNDYQDERNNDNPGQSLQGRGRK